MSRNQPTLLVGAALLLAILAFAGCGSSKSGSTGTSTVSSSPKGASVAVTASKPGISEPASEAQVITGERICAEANAILTPIAARSEAQFIRNLPRMAAVERGESSELAKLSQPVAMARDWEQMSEKMHLYSELVDKTARYATAGHQSSARHEFEKALRLQQEWVVIAKRDHLRQCSLAR